MILLKRIGPNDRFGGYQVVPTTAQEREQNRQALAAANAMRARRELEIINGKFDITQPKQGGVRFLHYYRQMCEDRLKTPNSNGNWRNWYSCLKHLEVYCDEATTFDDIDAEWIHGFKWKNRRPLTPCAIFSKL